MLTGFKIDRPIHRHRNGVKKVESVILEKLTRSLEKGQKAILATVIEVGDSTPGRVGSMMAIFEDGSTVGTVGGGSIEYNTISQALNLMTEEKSKLIEFNLEEDTKNSQVYCGGKSKIFLKAFKLRPKLVIVGAGHVAYEVYNVAKNLNYDIHIFDSREELCNKNRFSEASIKVGDVVKNLSEFDLDKNSYIVIAGPNHKEDERALEVLIKRASNYIGMLGSKKKVRAIKENLLSRGISKEHLDKLIAPIGIDVGSSEPSELAVGIMAEISIFKNRG